METFKQNCVFIISNKTDKLFIGDLKMARKRITMFDPLFTRTILCATSDDFKLNVSEVVRKERISDLNLQRFKTFWRRNKEKFNIDLEITLKDEYIDKYEEHLINFDIGDDEFLGDYLFRKQTEAKEQQKLHLKKMQKQESDTYNKS